MDFGTLKSRVLALIGRAPSDICYELVTADINQEVRLAAMEASTTLVESATITLPDDFLQVVSIYRDVNPRTILRPLTAQALQGAFQTSGIPQFYDIENGQLRLSPSPNGSENLILRYYAKLADLSGDDDTNAVLTSFPAIYVYGVLTHHAALIRDQEAAVIWLAGYEKAKQQARAADNRIRGGGAPIEPVARATA